MLATKKRIAALTTLAMVLMAFAPALAAGTEPVTAQRAIEIALADAGLAAADVLMTKVEDDTDDRQPSYDVGFLAGDTEYDYEIDAASGAVLKEEREAMDAEDRALLAGTYLTWEEALAAAYEAAGVDAPDATRVKVELDMDDGVARYDVEFTHQGTEHEIELDAVSGAVLKHETERNG